MEIKDPVFGIPPKYPQEELFEKLSSIEHKRWSDWQKYVHNVCIENDDGSITIPANYVKHWERQIHTDYKDLSQSEKDSDRDQVLRYWTVMKIHGRD